MRFKKASRYFKFSSNARTGWSTQTHSSPFFPSTGWVCAAILGPAISFQRMASCPRFCPMGVCMPASTPAMRSPMACILIQLHGHDHVKIAVLSADEARLVGIRHGKGYFFDLEIFQNVDQVMRIEADRKLVAGHVRRE